MGSETGENLEGILTRLPPCLRCRKKKIRCNKQTPCDNCQRSGLDCSYSQPQSIPVENEFYAELLGRIADLETRLAATERANTLPPDSQNTGNIGLETQSTTQLEGPLDCQCGRQIFRSNFSLHYNPTLHWIDLIPQLREIYFQISEQADTDESPQERTGLLFGHPQLKDSALQIPTYHPGQRQADELIKVFFDSVHPFTGIPNKKSFFGDLEKFRMGKLAQPPIFEALLYSIYGLALSSLPSNAVLGMFSMPKKRSLERFQDAQELALRRLNLLESNDISVFQVFLLYLVFLFEGGYYRTASVLISLAARLAQRIGLHKDPSWFTYSPWESEWRRRLWNLVILLDQKAITLEGLESELSYHWDTRLPENVNDSSWNTSPYSKPSETPVSTGAFSNMTPLLLKRQVLAVLCPLRQNLKTRTYAQQMQHIEAGFQKTSQLFLNADDELKGLASFMKSVRDIEFSTLRLTACQALVRTGILPPAFQEQRFRMAVELLEAINILEQDPLNRPWIWTFGTGQPLIAIAIVLSYLCSDHPAEYTERAWAQVDIAFRRNVDVHHSQVPIIAALEALRDIAEQSRLPVQETDMLEVEKQFQLQPDDFSLAAEGPSDLAFAWSMFE